MDQEKSSAHWFDALLDKLGWRSGAPLDATNEEIAPKGFAKSLLDAAPWLREHFRCTPHFGVLQLLAESNYSRTTYVVRHLNILLKIKEKHPTLGMGSAGASGITYEGKGLTGLEIAQSWALILNCGHLFGTFATERALHFTLCRQSAGHQELLKDIHPDLQPICKKLLKNESLYDFSKILSAWRISTEKIPPAIRNVAIQVLLAYFEEGNERLLRISKIYRSTRRIAYLTIHSSPAFGIPYDATSIDSLLEHIIEDDGIRFEPFDRRDVHIARLLSAIDRYQYDTFFTGKSAASEVLTHLGDFKHWWQKQEREGLTTRDRIARLMIKPSDWPERPSASDLLHIADFEIPLKNKKWIDETSLWWDQGNPWSKTNFFLTYGPEDNFAKINILAEGDVKNPLLNHIGIQLARHCINSWEKKSMSTDARIRLWRTIARYSQWLLSKAFKEKLHVTLKPINAEQEHQGYAALAVDAHALSERMDLFAEKCIRTNNQRSLEISAAAKYLRTLEHRDGLWLFVFASCLVTDGTREVNEIDGVFARIERDFIEWHFIEVKETGSRGAISQLERLRSNLRTSTTTISKILIEGQTITRLVAQQQEEA
ncbi:hypothetical protein ACN47A_31830 [Myxococcus fulvus]|uniref:hypothetical protein n=1 Tax=Myxococcus fulvus TaxID=33 RepID=UPI003B9C1B24